MEEEPSLEDMIDGDDNDDEAGGGEEDNNDDVGEAKKY